MDRKVARPVRLEKHGHRRRTSVVLSVVVQEGEELRGGGPSLGLERRADEG